MKSGGHKKLTLAYNIETILEIGPLEEFSHRSHAINCNVSPNERHMARRNATIVGIGLPT